MVWYIPLVSEKSAFSIIKVTDLAAGGKDGVEGRLKKCSGRSRGRWEKGVQAIFGEKVWDHWKYSRVD